MNCPYSEFIPQFSNARYPLELTIEQARAILIPTHFLTSPTLL
jgi:hypothetical protein